MSVFSSAEGRGLEEPAHLLFLAETSRIGLPQQFYLFIFNGGKDYSPECINSEKFKEKKKFP